MQNNGRLQACGSSSRLQRRTSRCTNSITGCEQSASAGHIQQPRQQAADNTACCKQVAPAGCSSSLSRLQQHPQQTASSNGLQADRNRLHAKAAAGCKQAAAAEAANSGDRAQAVGRSRLQQTAPAGRTQTTAAGRSAATGCSRQQRTACRTVTGCQNAASDLQACIRGYMGSSSRLQANRARLRTAGAAAGCNRQAARNSSRLHT